MLKDSADVNGYVLFYFSVLVNIAATLIGVSLLHLSVLLQFQVFSCCIFMQKFAIRFQNWFEQEKIDYGGFLLEQASECRHHFCMVYKMQEMVRKA